MSNAEEFILDRVFDAPRELVWRAWTDPKMLAQWYGPGVETVIHEFDLKVGGVWLNEMKWGENSMRSKAVFTEVNAPEKLVWHHHSVTDENWQPVANPKMPDWPKILLTVVTFKEEDGKTRLQLRWSPFEASENEIACFTQAVGNMGKGWESGFAIMDEMFAKM